MVDRHLFTYAYLLLFLENSSEVYSVWTTVVVAANPKGFARAVLRYVAALFSRGGLPNHQEHHKGAEFNTLIKTYCRCLISIYE